MTLNLGHEGVLCLHAGERAKRNAVRRVTSDLAKRVWQHKEGFVGGFTKQYGVKQLVWYEQHDSAESAITREKQLKKWNRAWKIELIQKMNPYWNDLCGDVAG